MKDLSLFLLKNSLAAKMKKGLRSFCNGVGSTSILNNQRRKSQHEHDLSCMATSSPVISSPYYPDHISKSPPPTLEEMILQLELEEEAARKAKLDDYDVCRRRMSCVNNSDILRSARSALNQYPRFSLDGRDAMYRSSFNNFTPVTRSRGGCSWCQSSSSSSSGGIGRRLYSEGFELDVERSLGLPPTLAGESVVWCKPGVVAKLMGLEAIPIPLFSHSKQYNTKKRMNKSASVMIKRENLRRAGRREMEKRRLAMGIINCREATAFSSSTSTDYCMMKPIVSVCDGGDLTQ
uniref:DUF3741 domain-containing protein n=1 Tax=Nelumbo nucifera TaxID=4432 RepID=A0A822ZF05_NELNU|nr:TPA_asm: hypothetical protein HUJ06_000259 [Nelumbo nucifera]